MREILKFDVHRTALDYTNIETKQRRVAAPKHSHAIVLHDDQIGKLQNALTDLCGKFDKLQLQTRRGPDDALKRIVFLGLPNKSYDQRVEHVEIHERACPGCSIQLLCVFPQERNKIQRDD